MEVSKNTDSGHVIMIDFEKEGVVSIWIGQSMDTPGVDVLEGLCGVDYYDVDFQECIISDKEQKIPVEDLVKQLSYSDSYLNDAVKSAREKTITSAVWVIMQLNYSYDPNAITKNISDDPIFLGVFEYEDDEEL